MELFEKERKGLRIVPALLGETWEGFLPLFRQAEAFADHVQIDLMDGHFVPTASFPGGRLSALDTRMGFEIHLMVDDPIPWFSAVRSPSLKRVVFHVESAVDIAGVIGRIRERGLDPVVAFRPETPFCGFEEVVDLVPATLFLTVDPGRYGSPFRPEVLKKVSEARRAFPDKEIAIDGGASLDNLAEIRQAGADTAVVGSRIFTRGDPAENFRLFVEKAQTAD